MLFGYELHYLLTAMFACILGVSGMSECRHVTYIHIVIITTIAIIIINIDRSSSSSSSSSSSNSSSNGSIMIVVCLVSLSGHPHARPT